MRRLLWFWELNWPSSWLPSSSVCTPISSRRHWTISAYLFVGCVWASTYWLSLYRISSIGIYLIWIWGICFYVTYRDGLLNYSSYSSMISYVYIFASCPMLLSCRSTGIYTTSAPINRSTSSVQHPNSTVTVLEDYSCGLALVRSLYRVAFSRDTRSIWCRKCSLSEPVSETACCSCSITWCSSTISSSYFPLNAYKLWAYFY